MHLYPKFIVCLFAAAVIASGPATPAASALSLATDPASLPPPPVSRQVEIDGRFVTVTLSLRRFIPGNIPEDWSGPATHVSAELSIQDGAPLPEGLTLTRIRFEKLRGTNRVFRAPMTEIATTTNVFELDAHAFQGDISKQARGVQRLKATARLEVNGRVIMVDMGTLRIGAAGITQ
jgi:hypothetical protein